MNVWGTGMSLCFRQKLPDPIGETRSGLSPRDAALTCGMEYKY